MAKSHIAASTALQIVSPLLFLTVLVQNNAINVAPGVAVAIVALLRLQLLQYRTEESYFWTSFLRDAQYFDIPFDEEDQHVVPNAQAEHMLWQLNRSRMLRFHCLQTSSATAHLSSIWATSVCFTMG